MATFAVDLLDQSMYAFQVLSNIVRDMSLRRFSNQSNISCVYDQCGDLHMFIAVKPLSVDYRLRQTNVASVVLAAHVNPQLLCIAIGTTTEPQSYRAINACICLLCLLY